MAVSTEVLRQHIDYTKWATDRLLQAVAQVPAEQLSHDFRTSDRTILGTLAHTFGADRIWLTRVRGETAAGFLTDEDRQLATLQRQWPVVLAGWREWLAALQDPAAVISYQDMKGNPYSSAAWEIVLHVVNHGTHHRGQVSGFLRTLGHAPPQLDLVRYYREGR
jgi:uncharacterized damage-inducible protein DinB